MDIGLRGSGTDAGGLRIFAENAGFLQDSLRKLGEFSVD